MENDDIIRREITPEERAASEEARRKASELWKAVEQIVGEEVADLAVKAYMMNRISKMPQEPLGKDKERVNIYDKDGRLEAIEIRPIRHEDWVQP